jgi:ring-1,2-phenylacetyl-CoA epoxidase subunit PaaD
MVMTEEHIWDLLEDVPDPEVPVLSILDLGVVRGVHLIDAENVEIVITPTYSGCPAMDMISMGIRMKLLQEGFRNIHIKTQLSPAWTTDWMSESGKQKLKEYGIAPPVSHSADELFGEEPAIQCPQCGSMHTTLISQFGSTSCKALYRCEDCREPFDYFKCHR